MESTAGHRKQTAAVRWPDTNGLPVEIVQVLRDSVVGILQMRSSIESIGVVVDASREAAIEGLGLLARLKAEGL
jgi:hypothetical protein